MDPTSTPTTHVTLVVDDRCVVREPNLGDSEILRFRQERDFLTFDIVQSYPNSAGKEDIFIFTFTGVKRFFYKSPFTQNVVMDAIYGEMSEIGEKNPGILAEAIRMFDEGPFSRIEHETGILFWIEPCACNNLIVHAGKLTVQRRAPQSGDEMWALVPYHDDTPRT